MIKDRQTVGLLTSAQQDRQVGAPRVRGHGTGRSNYVETIKNNRGVSRKHVAACEDDDLLDDYEDGEVDIDSGTEDIIQDRRMSDRRMGIGAAQAANRPTSASQSRPSRDRKLDGLAARSSVRPASASIAAILAQSSALVELALYVQAVPLIAIFIFALVRQQAVAR